MAVSMPSLEDFYAFWGDEAEQDDDRATLLLDLSYNLFWLATGLDDDPEDTRLASLVKYAICDMAVYLFVTRDSVNEDYSPFASEHIGSYSYAKSYGRLSKMIASSQNTGVPLFDQVVAQLIDQMAYGEGLLTGGKYVFQENYIPLGVDVTRAHFFRYPFGSADNDEGVWY